MTKKEIVDAVSASAGVSKKDTAAVIDSLLAAITDAVVKGDSVRFTGFGTFESRKRPARTGHNSRYRCHDRHPGFYCSGFQGRQGI